MKTQWFTVTLLSEVFIGRPGTLNGGHQGKDYLPGQVFLGVAASRLYNRLSTDEAWQVFHHGGLRFGDALPLTLENQPAWPMPLCWFRDKEHPAVVDGRLQASRITNHAVDCDGSPVRHAKRLEEGYVCADGKVVRPVTRLRMKAGIDPYRGRPADGRLFGYTGIARGSRFLMALEADDGVDQNLFDRVVTALTGECRVGRSRTAEYGHVRVEPATPHIPQSSAQPSRRLMIWLLSDLAVEDALGQAPVLDSHGIRLEWLGLGGLPEGRLNRDHSFPAWDRQAPYNAHYRAHEQERILMKRGSVLAFDLEEPVSMSGFACLGLHRQSGLGRVWLNPPLLASLHPVLEASPQPYQAPLVPEPDHQLVVWLKRQQRSLALSEEAGNLAREWAEELKKLYRSAHMLATGRPMERVGPSPSQWGRVRDLARQMAMDPKPDSEQLRHALFDADNAVCKGGDPQWSKAVLHQALTRVGQALPQFRDWLKHVMGDDRYGPDVVLEALARLARHGMDIAREQESQEAHV